MSLVAVALDLGTLGHRLLRLVQRRDSGRVSLAELEQLLGHRVAILELLAKCSALAIASADDIL